MEYSTHRITLDVAGQGVQASMALRHGESGHRLEIGLTDEGVIYPVSEDCYAMLAAEKSDGTQIFDSCTVENNILLYELGEQITACPGKTDCEVRLYGENGRLLIAPKFSIYVEDAVLDEDRVTSSSEYSALSNLIRNVRDNALSAVTEVSATVETGSGIPTVTLEEVPTETGKEMIFHFSGLKGERGDRGEIGPKGEKGATGTQGSQGIQGEKGETGEKGAKGDKGDQGDSGVYVGSGTIPSGYNVQIDPSGEIAFSSTVSVTVNGETYEQSDGDIDIGNVLRPPTSGLAVGKYFRVATYDSATGAVTLEAVNEPILEPIIGTESPTTSTVGKIGQLYFNSAIDSWYVLQGIAGDSYSWVQIITDSCGITGHLKIGNNKPPNAYNRAVAIGHKSSAGTGCVAIGGMATGTDLGTTAIGGAATASGRGSICIGHSARTSSVGAIQIGRGTNSIEYSLSVGFENWYDDPKGPYQLLDGNTGLIPFARMYNVRSTMDSVAVAGAQYYLGEQSAVTITMPTSVELGQAITVVFSSGTTACSLTCDLPGFGFVPQANKTNKLVFTFVGNAKWFVETLEN